MHQRSASPDFIRGKAAQRMVAAAPHLAHLVPLLTRSSRVLCSRTLKTASPFSGHEPLDACITSAPWIAFNNQQFTNVITVDVDHTDWQHKLDQAQRYYGLPKPNLVVADPWRGTAHVSWTIRDAVMMGDNARPMPKQTLASVREMLVRVLAGDPAYRGPLTKNPFARGRATSKGGTQPGLPAIWEAYAEARTGLRWHTISPNAEPVGLMTLHMACVAWCEKDGYPERKPPPWMQRRTAETTAWPKGTKVFNVARLRLYEMASGADERVAADVVLQVAQELGSPIADKAARRMGERIAKWIRKHHRWRPTHGRNAPVVEKPNRGIMGLQGSSVPMPTRYSMGGSFARARVAEQNDAAIARARDELRTEGLRVTQAAVAARAEVSVRTVASRWARIDELRADQPMAHDVPVSAPASPSEAHTVRDNPPEIAASGTMQQGGIRFVGARAAEGRDEQPPRSARPAATAPIVGLGLPGPVSSVIAGVIASSAAKIAPETTILPAAAPIGAEAEPWRPLLPVRSVAEQLAALGFGPDGRPLALPPWRPPWREP